MNEVDVAKVKVLVKNVKQECPELVAKFSEHALAEIAKEEIIKDFCFPGDNDNLSLVDRCTESMKNQLKTTHKDQKKLLQDCLYNDCELFHMEIAEMSPRQKVKNWLEWNGIQGFTDDILDVVSAAYDIILEPDLNK